MNNMEKIIDQVQKINALFVEPMFKQSAYYVFSAETHLPGIETKLIIDDYDKLDDAWRNPGVYVFLDSKAKPIYCGEAARHLWGRVYDYFAKKTAQPLSKLHSRVPWDEVPAAVVLLHITSNDSDNFGFGYALETRILNHVKLEYNKKKN